jgi:hypothetical protein
VEARGLKGYTKTIEYRPIMRCSYWILAVFLLSPLALAFPPGVYAQQLAKRLILKDGSYQLATQWEVKGDRVRYLSAERNEWEELPNSLVDWAATEKFQRERAAGLPSPEAVELDKELAAERAAEEAKTPQVAPGLRLSEDGSVMLLDSFHNEPQLVELQQTSGELNRNRKENILRAAVNPVASSKQPIELEGAHAKVQSHATLPSIYINLASQEDAKRPQLPWDRFHIVRMKSKNGKRIVADIKISVIGKATQEQDLVATTSQQLTGGWVKVTPTNPLEPGEYAVVELVGKEGINTFVWDFGINPSAPPNPGAVKPSPHPGGSPNP